MSLDDGDLNTWGELLRWAELNGVTANTPLWRDHTVYENGSGYPAGQLSYSVHVMMQPATFGLALPPERRRAETGLIFW